MTTPAAVEWLVRRRVALLLLSVALVVAAAAGLTRLRFDVSNESLFLEGDETVARFHAMQREFGSDEVVYVLCDVADPLREPARGHLLALGRRLKALPFVAELRSPLHSPVSYVEGDTIISRSFADALARGEPVEAWRARLHDWSPFRALLLSADGRSVGFLLRIDREAMTPDGRRHVTDTLQRLVRDGPWSELRSEVVGTPLIITLQARILGREVARAFVGGLLVTAALLLFIFRSVRAVVAPLVVVFASAVSAFGVMGWAGVPLSTLSPILVTVVICAGIADAVHLLAAYERHHGAAGLPPERALAVAVHEVVWPCLFTTLTTMAGFAALLTSYLRPIQHLGVFTALGGAAAFVFLFTVTPALLVGWRPAAPTDATPRPLARLLEALHRLTTRRPALVLGAAALASALAIPGVTRLYVDQNLLEDMPPDEPLRQQLEFVHARMGGTVACEVLVEALEAPRDPTPTARLLREVAAFEDWARQSHPRVRAVVSVTSGLREVHRLFDGPREVPATDDAVAQLLFVLQSGDPELYRAHVSRDGRTVRVTVRFDMLSSRENRRLLAQVEAELERRFAGLARTTITGGARLLARSGDYILDTQRTSFGLAFLQVLVLIAVWTRELRLGLLSVAPNVLPIGVVLGLMGWAGIPISVTNALIASMAMGMIIDDTIHSTYCLREELARLGPARVDEAIHAAMQRSGRSILFTTLVLVGTFATYLTSSDRSVRSFGGLASLVFLVAFLADALLLPASVKLWHSLRRRGGG